MQVLVKGAGVAGLTVAHALSMRGVDVTVADALERAGGKASWCAGGMLAPWCERESAPEDIVKLGRTAADWWEVALPGHVTRNGTLVVTPARDVAELGRFATRTSGFERLDADTIAALEPDLAGRFRSGLFFRNEAHLDPRRALTALAEKLGRNGVIFQLGKAVDSSSMRFDRVVDCTGAAAIGRSPALRGVRGEMLLLETPDIRLSRPVRLLHPRIPLYVVPRGEGRFMVGATMIESDDDGPASARSVMELLNAAYTLHPAFGEARVVEMATGVRPAFSDNLPRFDADGRVITVNGFYRHGFLLSPAIAASVADHVASPADAGREERTKVSGRSKQSLTRANPFEGASP